MESAWRNTGLLLKNGPSNRKNQDGQRDLEWLKGEKKALRRRWKSAKEDEKVGLSVLWEELKERARNLHVPRILDRRTMGGRKLIGNFSVIHTCMESSARPSETRRA